MKVRKWTTVLVAAVAAMLVMAPLASAKGHHHGDRGQHRGGVCGTVDASSVLPGTLVVAKQDATLVTVQNTNNVAIDAAITVGSTVCAKVTNTAAAGAAPALVLVAIKAVTPKVKAYARVAASGPITIGAGSVTVATLTFALPTGFTLPAEITADTVVAVRGSILAAGGALTLDRIHVAGGHGHHGHHRDGGKGGKGDNHGTPPAGQTAKMPSASVRGPITALTAATADAAGSIAIAGITFVVPAGTTLNPKAIVGAKGRARGTVVAGVLTLGGRCSRIHAI
jgi:hypothetical protein